MNERQAQIEENYKRTPTAYNMQTSGELEKLEQTKQAARSKEFDIRREALRRQAARTLRCVEYGPVACNWLFVGLLDVMAQAGSDISALNVMSVSKRIRPDVTSMRCTRKPRPEPVLSSRTHQVPCTSRLDLEQPSRSARVPSMLTPGIRCRGIRLLS